MRRATSLAAVFALFVATQALVHADDAATGDLKKLQGTWVTDGQGPDTRWTFDGEKLKATVNGAEYTCTVKLDEKATPRTADFTIKDGPGDVSGKVAKAIYKFDGEKVVLCTTHPGADNRPTEFKEVEGEVILLQLKKEAN